MKNNKSKRYTREEDEAIFRAVQGTEASLKECFIAVAHDLGRTSTGVATRWYTELSNPESPNYMGTAMLLIKKERASQNRTTMKFPVKTKVSIWTRLLNLLKLH